MSGLVWSWSFQVVDIDPTSESTFPGITEMREALEVSQSKSCALSHLTYVPVYLSQDWEWNYGKSPKFSVTANKSFHFGHLVRETDSTGLMLVCINREPSFH